MPNYFSRYGHFFLTICLGLCLGPARSAAAPGRERKQAPPPTSPGVIKSEANMVLVNVIVTDKEGHYLRDLKRKDFRVYEDGKEQSIASFTHQAGGGADALVRQAGQPQPGENAGTKPIKPRPPHYVVMFFDCVFLEADKQMYERDQAVKFVESTASEYRKIAVLNFDGTLHLDQDFTSDGPVLKKAIEIPRFSPYVHRPMSDAQTDAVVRYEMRSLRNIANTLGRSPGRKTVIFLSNGIQGRPQTMSEFKAMVDAFNRANVGVYTIGAEGLKGMPIASAAKGPVVDSLVLGRGAGFAPVPPPGLRQFAAMTGGFAYLNRNELRLGMEKAVEEQDEYYIISYIPPNPVHDGRYHKVRVKVDRRDAEVRARDGYNDTRSPNLLAGKVEGKVLEAQAASPNPGEIPLSVTVPYFYLKPNLARVNLTMSMPVAAIKFKRQIDEYHGELNALGMATRADGSVAARFSDAVSVDYNKDLPPTKTSLYYYENSFKIAPGKYTFTLVLSGGGDQFGKYSTPIEVKPFTGKDLTLSGPAFGDSLAPYAVEFSDLDPALIEGSVPMVSHDAQVVPSSSNRFKTGKQPVVYVEIYDPLLAASQPQEAFLYNIVDRKTDHNVYSSPPISVDQNVHAGKPRVPVIFNLLIDKLTPGDYRLEIQARDSEGNFSPVRTGDFSVE